MRLAPMGRAACWLAAVVVGARSLPAQDEVQVDFATVVWPILEARCVDCHRGAYRDADDRLRKPKGGLRLDGKAWIGHGGDGGPVLVAGDPTASSLYTRVLLEADDPDVMPAEGERLTSPEVEVLRRWIAGGADFGAWLGVTADAPAPTIERRSSRAVEYARRAAGLRPPTPDSLAEALGSFGHAAPLEADGRLLRVSFPARQSEIDGRVITRLAPIRAHIAELDLARSRIGDDDLRSVARLQNLARLDLRSTGVTDRGLAHLAALDGLQHLVLVDTAVTDHGLAGLAELPSLRIVRLWGSAVTPAGVAALRAALPDADVGFERELPAPEPPVERGRRRR